MPGLPRPGAAGRADPHVRLRPGRVEPHPGRPAPPLARRPSKGTSYAESDRALTAMKKDPDLAFLSECPRCRCSRRCGTSTGRSPRSSPGVPATRGSSPAAVAVRALHPSAFTMRGGVLRLAKMSTPLRYVWSWPDVDVAELDPAMVIVSREPDGRWYVTFTIEAATRNRCPPDLARCRRGPRREGLRRHQRRGADPQPAAPGAQGPQAGPLPAADGPLPARVRQPGQSQRPRSLAPTARSATRARDFLHRASTRLVRAPRCDRHRGPRHLRT